MSFADAVWKTPLVIPIVLLPIRNERQGGASGPSYVTRAQMAAQNKARAFLEAHFEIVDATPAEIGWKLGADTTLKI